MLIKDGEPVAVPADFLKKFTKPLVFRLTKEQTPIDHSTGKRKVPRSFSPPTEYSYFDLSKRKVVTFKFAENASRHNINGMPVEVHTPNRISFRNGQIVCDPNKDSHIELAYWLYTHPRNQSSEYYDNTKSAWFEVEDRVAEARERNTKRSSRAKAEHLIFEVWGKNELAEICRSFDISSVDEMSVDEMQDVLSGLMDRDPIGFMERAEDEQMVLRAKIAQGKEFGVIVYEPKNNRWVWGIPTDKENEEIVRVRPGENEKTRLIQHWNRVAKEENLEYFYDQLNFAIEKKKAERDARVSKRGKKKEEPSQSSD
jgi:hypothetical protein